MKRKHIQDVVAVAALALLLLPRPTHGSDNPPIPDNEPPSISLGADTLVRQTDPQVEVCVSYSVSDPDGLTGLTESVASGPAGTAIDTVNNRICFTPSDTGVFQIVGKVQDSWNANDFDTVLVRVSRVVLNLEIDYLYGPDHNHAMTQDQIDAMVAMFACHNITLNVELSDSIPEPLGHCTPEQGDDSWGALLNTYRSHAEPPDSGGWRHGLLTHSMCVNPHIGYAAGYNFRANNSQEFNSLALIVHELGHCIGIPDKDGPNYLSIMGGQYCPGIAPVVAMRGLNPWGVPLKRLDYSNGTRLPLNEAALVESDGIGLGPVDWNRNGQIDAGVLAETVNVLLYHTGDCPPGTGAVYTDFNDWGRIDSVLGVTSWPPDTSSAIFVEEWPVTDTSSIVNTECIRFFYPYPYLYQGDAETLAAPWVEPCLPPYHDNDGDDVDDDFDRCRAQISNTCCCRVPGDVNHDGSVTHTDIDYLNANLFSNGPAPSCLEEADVDGDGDNDVFDLVKLSECVYVGGVRLSCGQANP